MVVVVLFGGYIVARYLREAANVRSEHVFRKKTVLRSTETPT